jgi:hypothetical protein
MVYASESEEYCKIIKRKLGVFDLRRDWQVHVQSLSYGNQLFRYERAMEQKSLPFKPSYRLTYD